MTPLLAPFTPARFAEVPRDRVFVADALALLKALPDASVQLIAVDPLDCFCGSGTTLDAARRNDRHYIGGDFTEHWVTYSRRRVAMNYDVKLPLFEEVSA